MSKANRRLTSSVRSKTVEPPLKPDFHCDVVIVGGGIAGLWLSATLSQAGYHTLLFEKDTLGCGQTLAAQGIIHGGTKYALTGKFTGSSEAVRAMPGRWRAHLNGQRQPNLSGVSVNSQHQWMWPSNSLGSKIAGFFASKLMTSRVSRVAAALLPEMLNDKTVYQLQEPVLDVASLLQVLLDQSRGGAYQAEVTDIIESGEGVQLKCVSSAGSAMVRAQLVICTAGAGNEALLPAVEMQTRGLHMVMVRGDLPEIWAHIIEADATPRLTITTHKIDDATVWYLGGQLAEQGVGREHEVQIDFASKEMKSLLPALDWDNMQWSAFRIDRAEGRQSHGARPDRPVIRQQGRQIIIWPTKLAFAPLVADEVSGLLQSMAVRPGVVEQLSPNLQQAELGHYPWDEAQWIGTHDQ